MKTHFCSALPADDSASFQAFSASRAELASGSRKVWKKIFPSMPLLTSSLRYSVALFSEVPMLGTSRPISPMTAPLSSLITAGSETPPGQPEYGLRSLSVGMMVGHGLSASMILR